MDLALAATVVVLLVLLVALFSRCQHAVAERKAASRKAHELLSEADAEIAGLRKDARCWADTQARYCHQIAMLKKTCEKNDQLIRHLEAELEKARMRVFEVTGQ